MQQLGVRLLAVAPGTVTLALPQDVQTQAFDCPDDFLHPGLIRFRRPPAEASELAAAAGTRAAGAWAEAGTGTIASNAASRKRHRIIPIAWCETIW